jgi:hypothetical protein
VSSCQQALARVIGAPDAQAQAIARIDMMLSALVVHTQGCTTGEDSLFDQTNYLPAANCVFLGVFGVSRPG